VGLKRFNETLAAPGLHVTGDVTIDGTLTGGGAGGLAIGGTITDATAGSVLFVDADGELAQDPTNFGYNGTTVRALLGQTSSLYGTSGTGMLTLTGDPDAPTITPILLELAMAQVSAANGNHPILRGRSLGGPLAAPTALARNDPLLEIDFGGYGGADYFDNAAKIRGYIDGTPDADNGIMPGRLDLQTQDTTGSYRTRLRLTSVGTTALAAPDAASTIVLAGQVESQGDVFATGYMRKLAAAGSDQVTNGGFTGDASGWTLGAAWHYNANAVDKDTDGTSTLAQDVSAVQGQVYNVTYTISTLTAGSVTMSVGGVSGTTRSADGTYTDSIKATGTGNLTFTPSNDARFTLDDVAVVQVGYWQQAHIADPAADAGACATAIASILDALEAYGLLATS
jgi:hypothetical protein